MQGAQVQSLGQKNPLEDEMTTPSCILAWEIPWTEEPGGLQFMGSLRIRRNLVTKQSHMSKKKPTNYQVAKLIRGKCW